MSDSDTSPSTFEFLAASRRQWIDDVLQPWCRQANLKQLRQAEAEWLDIAGRVDVNATLWTWSWERFDGLTYPDLVGVNETLEVRVRLADGTQVEGFPDSRQSVRGMLVLSDRDSLTGNITTLGPYSIDDIAVVEIIGAS